MKISGTNTFSDQVPIIATTDQFAFLGIHDFFQLGSNFANFSHCFGVNKMFSAPTVGVLVTLPLLVNVEVSHVVTFGNVKFFTHSI